MRIATWNVNSVRPRVPRMIEWLEQRTPDVVCLQETKATDDAFDALLGADLTRLGYTWAHHGFGQWNGVAVLSRVGLEHPEIGFPDMPGFPEPEARAISAMCDGVRVRSIYVPNGRALDDPHYAYKLAWLGALRDTIASEVGPGITLGDINIAPTDADVYDPSVFVDGTHVSIAERDALAQILDAGVVDVMRDRWPTEQIYTYWDYRALAFPKNQGMRIDLALATPDVAARVAAAWVDREARKGKGTSDHTPVIVDLDKAPDGDIGPMVPPPSSRGRR